MNDYGLNFSCRRVKELPELLLALRRAKVSLPTKFLSSFLNWNGREALEQYIYEGQPRERVSVHFFHDLTDVAQVKELRDAARLHNLKELFPVACDEGGSFICVHSRDGSIWFVDHEVGGMKGHFKLEASIDSFMSKLKPFQL